MFKNLIPLSLPKPQLKLARNGSKLLVWDDIRRKYLQLTPEEWVRQHLVHYLVNYRKFPRSSITLESSFQLNKKSQRTDILIYKNLLPWLLIECKAPQLLLSQKTFDQATRYNLHYKTPYLIVSNGLQHFVVKMKHGEKKCELLDDLPDYHNPLSFF